jgi:hypothetical protein
VRVYPRPHWAGSVWRERGGGGREGERERERERGRERGREGGREREGEREGGREGGEFMRRVHAKCAHMLAAHIHSARVGRCTLGVFAGALVKVAGAVGVRVRVGGEPRDPRVDVGGPAVRHDAGRVQVVAVAAGAIAAAGAGSVYRG